MTVPGRQDNSKSSTPDQKLLQLAASKRSFAQWIGSAKLPSGEVSLEKTAGILNRSSRKLADQGQSFGVLLNEARSPISALRSVLPDSAVCRCE